jgi:hypothetical protein
MKKEKCPKCGRLVGLTKDGIFVKHRTKRGAVNKEKSSRAPICAATGTVKE